MIKKVLFVFFISLSLIYAFGLRNVKVGEKLPVTAETKVFETGKPKVILVADSQKMKTKNYFEAILPVLNKTKVDFFFVDTAENFSELSKNLFNKIVSEKKYILDKDKKLFGQLGVIVMPTLLVVESDNTLHSFVSGKKHDLELVVSEYVSAMLTGKKAGNVYAKFNEKKKANKNHMALNRAFKMLINKNYEISASLYKKAIEKNASLEGKLGYFYSLLLNDMVEDAASFAKTFSENELANNRVKFALAYLNAIQSESEDNFKQISDNCHYETKFFTAVFEAGEFLRKNKQLKLSSEVYRQAYKVLMNTYRRGR